MDAGDLVERATQILGGEQDPQRLTDTIVAAGVLCADPSLGLSAGRGAPELRDQVQGALGEQAPATFGWSDPGDWMLANQDTCAWLSDWWTLGSHVVDGPAARLAVSGSDPLEALADVVELLAAGSGVGSAIIARSPGPGGRPAPRWTWPLRVIRERDPGQQDGAATESTRARLRWYAPWWDDLVTEAAGRGPWAHASLGLFFPDSTDPVKAGAPAVGVAVGLTAGRQLRQVGSLARFADRYGAPVGAAVDPGTDPERWLAELLAALASDQPADFALHTACRASGGSQGPFIVAELSYLETTRLRNVLARSWQAHPGGPPIGADDPLHRLLRGAPTSGLRVADDFTDPDDGAVRAARYLARQRREDQRNPVRVLRAHLIDATAGGDDRVITILRPFTSYRLQAWIGAAANQVVNRTPPFPARLLPQDDAAELLIVVSGLPAADVAEADSGNAIGQGRIVLPTAGDLH